jgi:predicted Zn-dependent protease
VRGAAPRWLAGSIALANAIFSLGCSSSAGAEERQREVILRSEDVDRKVGEETAQSVKEQLGLIEDPELVAYVNQVGARLARHAPRRGFEYSFQIVDQEAPNAFALPGGFIFVSRGLLALANSEDELANVLGHEIVHVAARHAAARQEVGRSLPAKLDWMQGSYLASYGRDQEREADRLGQGLAAVAGYDPAGLAVFLRELEHTERLRLGGSRLPGFWDTHPSTSRRVAEASTRANMAAWTRQAPIAETRTDFLQRMEGLAIGARAAEGVFLGDRFMHADLDLFIHFPPGWKTANTHLAVGAVAPTRDAQIFLEIQGKGSDVERAAGEYIAELAASGFKVDNAQPVKLASSAAFRVDGQLSGMNVQVRAQLTWLERRGSIYRFTAVAPAAVFPRYTGSFLNVPRSLRDLEEHERAKIRENRLRIAVAREGENLAQLSERTANRWDIQQTAVMNGLFADRVLESGQLVKIAVAENYRPDAEATATE